MLEKLTEKLGRNKTSPVTSDKSGRQRDAAGFRVRHRRGKHPLHVVAIKSFLLLFVVFYYSLAFSFNIPETLKFDLLWTGIKAGESVMEIKNDATGTIITSMTRSSDWISIFYTVDDKIESRLIRDDPKNLIGHPVQYKIKIREGRHRKNKEVIFDQENSKAVYIDYLDNERKEFDLIAPVFDVLSSFYYIRTLDLEVGKSVYVTVFDSKKIWNVEVKVLRKEKIEVSGTEYNTIVVKPLLKSEGIFYRKGEVYLWLTDDEKKIPVKVKTKVKIGSITANLVGGSF